MKMVGTFAVFFMLAVAERFVRRHTRQLECSYQSVHSSDTDVNAIITLKNIGNLVGTKSFVIISINLKN